MDIFKWKPVNPDSRLPGYLQNHTKENMIWQFKLLGVLFIGIWIYSYIEERREKRKHAAWKKTQPTPVK